MKILFVNYTMNIGGIESFLLNITKEIKKHKNNVEFLCYNEEKYDLEDEIVRMNCKIHRIDNPEKVSCIKHLRQLYHFLKHENYDVVHCNTYTNSGYVMLAAFLAGIKVRVTHSHTSQQPKSNVQKLKWFIAKILIQIFSNKKLACSDVAGKSLFLGNKFEVLENGIDLSKYSFNSDMRDSIRNKYSIKNDEIVIGHVGRFAPVKNHKYIIDIFKSLKQNYKLLLIGDGPEFNKIKSIIKEENLTDRVILTGNVRNTYDFLNAMDLILFPSLYEGLPVSLVEAQMNGLQIISSNNVSDEINLFGNVHFFDLNDSKGIVKKIIYKVGNKRICNSTYFKKSNYNIKNTCDKIIDIYNS